MSINKKALAGAFVALAMIVTPYSVASMAEVEGVECEQVLVRDAWTETITEEQLTGKIEKWTWTNNPVKPENTPLEDQTGWNYAGETNDSKGRDPENQNKIVNLSNEQSGNASWFYYQTKTVVVVVDTIEHPAVYEEVCEEPTDMCTIEGLEALDADDPNCKVTTLLVGGYSAF